MLARARVRAGVLKEIDRKKKSAVKMALQLSNACIMPAIISVRASSFIIFFILDTLQIVKIAAIKSIILYGAASCT